MDMEEIWSIPLADVASNWRQFSYRDPQGATYTVDLVQLRIFDNLVEATGRSGLAQSSHKEQKAGCGL
jgi:hypothetical protein